MKHITMRNIAIFMFALLVANPAMAGKSKVKMKVKKNGQSVSAIQRFSRAPASKPKKVTNIQDAMDQSEADHRRLKKKVSLKTDKRMQALDTRSTETIEIKNNSAPVLDMGSDAALDNHQGEDTSGLNNLRSHIEEESTDIDFESELREVSSTKKKK